MDLIQQRQLMLTKLFLRCKLGLNTLLYFPKNICPNGKKYYTSQRKLLSVVS